MRLPFAKPYTNRVLSGYGYRTYTHNGKTITDWHNGIDITGSREWMGVDGNNTPTKLIPVQAVESGQILNSGNTGDSRGNFVEIQVAGKNMRHYYYHLFSITKTSGLAAEGEQIGIMGNTDGSTGPHLHFEVRKGNYKWAEDAENADSVNPATYLGISNNVGSITDDSGPSNPGTVDPGEDNTAYNEAVATRDSLRASLNTLTAQLEEAKQNRAAAESTYNQNRSLQTAAETEIPKAETKVTQLQNTITQQMESLRSYVVDVLAKARTSTVSAIQALRERIAARLEAIRKRLEGTQSPITGCFSGVEQAAEDLFSLHRTEALKAEAYDEKELPAPQYDGRELEALEYDMNAKKHLQ